MIAETVEQTFWEHIRSLRNHLLCGAAFFVVSAIAAFALFTDKLIHLLLLPLHGQALVFLAVLGPFLFKMKVSFLAGAVISLPAWTALLFHFAAPGMPRGGRVPCVVFVAAAGALAVLSIGVTYFYLVPMTLDVLRAVPVEGTSLVLTAEGYLDFFFLEFVIALVVLQAPLAINVLAYVGILDPRAIRGKRSIVYIVLLVALAIMTPTTDIASLLLAFVPAVLFTEAGFGIAGLIHARRN
jgi:sec-independent protein translocase protein TatC